MKTGKITKILNAQSGLDIEQHAGTTAKYILEDGYHWFDSAGRHGKGDTVRIEPYIMGTVRAVNLTKGDSK